MCLESPGKQDILNEIRDNMDKQREEIKQKTEMKPRLIDEHIQLPKVAIKSPMQMNDIQDYTDQDVSAFVNVGTEPQRQPTT